MLNVIIVDVGKIVIRTENIYLGKEECTLIKDLLPGSYVVFTVSDNGVGMDLDTQEKIFEPFYTTKVVGHGTGLGLSTVYGIVRQNNCFINVESRLGEGATFRIYFPSNDEKPAAVNLKLAPEPDQVVERPYSLLRMTALF